MTPQTRTFQQQTKPAAKDWPTSNWWLLLAAALSSWLWIWTLQDATRYLLKLNTAVFIRLLFGA